MRFWGSTTGLVAVALFAAATFSGSTVLNEGEDAARAADVSAVGPSTQTAFATGDLSAALESTVSVKVATCSEVREGLGVLIDGVVYTNRHLVDGAGSVIVERGGVEPMLVTTIDVSNEVDLARLVIARAPKTQTRFGLTRATSGSALTVARRKTGALSAARSNLATVAHGRDGSSNVQRLATAVSPGDSGGGVFDADGTVVGIVFARAPDGDDALMIPVDKIADEIPRLVRAELASC